MQYARDFQSYVGPGDADLPRSELSGYQPVSRIGEIVVNAFVDPYVFASIPDSIIGKHMIGDNRSGAARKDDDVCEHKPAYHEWGNAALVGHDLPFLCACARLRIIE